MGGILEWVGSLLFFMVFITVADNLLPGRKYSRYLRLCGGMVLILLVIGPVTGGLHLEDQMARWFEAASFRQEANDLSREILGIENQRLSKIVDSYQEAVETDVNAMAAEMGLVPVETWVEIGRDESREDYGTVVRIRMEVGRQGQDSEEGGAAEVLAVNPVEPVAVTVEKEETGGETAEGQREDAEESGSRKDRETIADHGALEQLRRKVEVYYGLETGKVEIQLEGE